MRPRSKAALLCVSLVALASQPSCGSHGSGATSTSSTSSTSTTVPSTGTATVAAPPSAPPASSGPRTKNWFDLNVGDCLTEIPAIDVGVVTATLVDCASPHQAEVFLLAPLTVDTATADVAEQKCTEAFSSYTGQPVNGSLFTVAYLIDSNQDRTSNNPTPSTAICFLQAANGGPLTTSARR